MLAECEVYNCYHLTVRGGPGMSYSPVAWFDKGDKFTSDKLVNGWYKVKGKEQYMYKTYVKVVKNLENPKPVKPAPAPTSTAKTEQPSEMYKANLNIKTQPTGQKEIIGNTINTGYINIDERTGTSNNLESINGKLVNNQRVTDNSLDDSYGLFYLHTNASYPTKIATKTVNGKSFPVYSWEMNHKTAAGGSQSLVDMYEIICKNLELQSSLTKTEVNKNIHLHFNRFRKEYPDMYLKNTMGVIIFTRPDLNLFNSDLTTMNSYVASDPRCNLIIHNNKTASKLLTAHGTGSEGHKFNPLLSNLAQSLEISDDSVDLLELGETFTGYKMQYSKHNIKSITAGTFSIKYKETFDLAVTNTHQLWVDYQSNVYRGLFTPKREYIYNKELDYACDVYYFLLDQDGETIKFWSKYYGVFPNNVPKSVYSFDFGSPVSFPELSVTYSYIYKEDLSPVALIEFNENAGVINGTNTQYVRSYESKYGHSGHSWVGTPFVYSFTYSNGMEHGVQGFKLGWKKKRD